MVVRNRKLAQTKWANASYIAANLNDFNTGWAFVQGSCGGANFTRGLGSPKKVCGGLTVKTTFSGASFTVGNWTLTVHGNYVYGRISGPQHRLDLAFKARGDAPARSVPHGIVGQVRERGGGRGRACREWQRDTTSPATLSDLRLLPLVLLVDGPAPWEEGRLSQGGPHRDLCDGFCIASAQPHNLTSTCTLPL